MLLYNYKFISIEGAVMSQYIERKTQIVELSKSDFRRWKDLHNQEGTKVLLLILLLLLAMLVVSFILSPRVGIHPMGVFMISLLPTLALSAVVIGMSDYYFKRRGKEPAESKNQIEQNKILLENGWDGVTPYRLKLKSN